MKKKEKIVDPKFIYDELFQTNIYVSYGVSPEYLVKQIDKCLGIKYPLEDLQNAIGKHIVFANKDDNEIIWIWTKLPKLDVLIHELTHTAVRTLTVAGIQINSYTDEILAYYMQYLIRKLDLLEGKKMMRKDVRTCDNCQKHIDSHSAYDKGWIMFEGISKYFRIIHKNNEKKTQGRQFEGEYLDFCCVECLKKYFNDMVKVKDEQGKE